MVNGAILNRSKRLAVCLAMTAGLTGGVVAAPQVDASELAALNATAARKKYVHVLINLDVDNSLAALAKRKNPAASDYDKEVAFVLSQIEGTYLEKTVWKSVFGQVSLYITQPGLAKLANASGVKKITIAPTSSNIYDPKNELKAIEEEILVQGAAPVKVIPQSVKPSWSLRPDGGSEFKSPNQAKSSDSEAEKFISSLSPQSYTSYEISSRKAGSNSSDPSILLNLTLEGFYELTSRKDILSVQSADSAQKAQRSRPVFDNEALEEARRTGKALINIDLRRPAGYTPLLDSLSPEARLSQVNSLHAAFKEIVEAAEPSALTTLQTIDGIASATVEMTLKGLTALYQRADPRIEGVRLVKPLVQTSLYGSTAAGPGGTNAQYLHNSYGLRGAGQWIAVLDTGVQRTHPMLSGKYVAEACFGTTGAGYKSWCKDSTVNGDSPYLTTDSALPCGIAATFSAGHECTHGTHIAGIAGGRLNLSNSSASTNGIAPDADFFFVNIFSASTSLGLGKIYGFGQDIAAGMVFVNQLRNDFPGITINLSVGGYTTSSSGATFPFVGDCNYVDQAVSDMIALLYSRNVAVIAPTGNKSFRNGISFPACVANVVKVAGSVNTTGSFENFSDINYKSHYTGPFFLAPSNVISSVPGSILQRQAGTSQAAAHISGAFAMIKAAAPNASIADVVAYIAGAHSVKQSVPLAVFGGGEDVNKFDRLRFQ